MKNIIFVISTVLMLAACATEQTKKQPITLATPNSQMIEISSNQTLFVEAIVTDGKVTRMTPVTEIKNPEITLTLEFKPFDKGMLLQVNNPFAQDIKYNIDMIDRNGKAHQTSSCVVIAKGAVFENWPHPIPKLQIKNIRLLKNNEKIACVY